MSPFLFSNFEEHPSDENYLVFRYLSKPMADEFSTTLLERGIPFETIENEEKQTVYLYAVKKKYGDEVKKLNYLIYAKHRKPLIENKYTRNLLLGTVLTLIILGLIGYMKVNGYF